MTDIQSIAKGYTDEDYPVTMNIKTFRKYIAVVEAARGALYDEENSDTHNELNMRLQELDEVINSELESIDYGK